MANKEQKFNRRRLRSSYIISVVSIAMVLVVLGLQGWLLLSARKISSDNESFQLTLFFRDTVSVTRITEIKAHLEKLPEVKMVQYTDRETAAKIFQAELGEDFVEFLGYNPMPASLSVVFKPEAANEAVFNEFEKVWSVNPNIEKIDYPRNLLLAMAANMKMLGWILMVAGILMAVISVTLINNTIRLSIYSKRFLIKTMLLVGATQAFIRRPFIYSGIVQGFIGGVLSCLFLGVIIWFGEQKIPGLREQRNIYDLGILASGLIISGILLSVICTFFAVRKYLNIKTDSLY